MKLLSHRGPDDSGIWNDDQAVLGHRRLSIIDLSPSGHQPMISADGKLVVVFNGEIYNYRELRNQFASKMLFRYNNDTEVILKLYEAFGSGCLEYLRGLFSFAIWDKEKEELFFARDRLGKKPFFYAIHGDHFIFASELRSLLVHTDFDFEINQEAIFHYLTLQYIPSPLTIYKKVFKLPPAHFGILRKGILKIEKYWSPKYETKNWSEPEALERLDELMKESVRLRMVSDVPVGAMLSGGVDSTAVVALMTEFSSKPIQTFTIGFEEEAYSESVFAREVAEYFKTDHRERTVRADFINVLPQLVEQFCEPFGDSSAIPSFYLSQMIGQHVKVALSGDGGDELFGGYERYQFRRPKDYGALANSIANVFQKIPMNLRYVWHFRKFIDEHMGNLPAVYMGKICFFDESEKQDLFTAEFKEETKHLSTLSLFARWFQKFDSVSFPQNLMAVDLETYLPDDILVKVDISSMACSLETRSPLLDHKLVEFCCELPVNLKMRDKTPKYLLKRYLANRVPERVLTRQKMGFRLPIKVWFRKELNGYLREILLDSTAIQRGYFKRSSIEKLIERHSSGWFDNTHKLYALLVLELWHRIFVDRRGNSYCQEPLDKAESAYAVKNLEPR